MGCRGPRGRPKGGARPSMPACPWAANYGPNYGFGCCGPGGCECPGCCVVGRVPWVVWPPTTLFARYLLCPTKVARYLLCSQKLPLAAMPRQPPFGAFVDQPGAQCPCGYHPSKQIGGVPPKRAAPRGGAVARGGGVVRGLPPTGGYPPPGQPNWFGMFAVISAIGEHLPAAAGGGPRLGWVALHGWGRIAGTTL